MRMKNNIGLSGKTDKVLIILGIIFFIVFVVSGLKVLDYYRDYRDQKQSYDEIAALRDGGNEIQNIDDGTKNEETGSDVLHGESTETVKESEKRLRAVNDDYIGWITVPDTNIYYPVVQRDNSYYLNHDFYKKTSSHGAIFMDETCSAEDDVILIHGHHMKDGTMFGALKGFKKKAFWEDHDTLYLDWGTGDETYRIFAAALIDLTQDDWFHYEELPRTEEEREGYLKELKQNALWYEEPEQGQTGQIVLLSTCEYGTGQQRLVVAAVSEALKQ